LQSIGGTGTRALRWQRAERDLIHLNRSSCTDCTPWRRVWIAVVLRDGRGSGVIPRQLPNGAIAHQVGAAVAHMRNQQRRLHDRGRRDGRMHSEQRRLLLCHPVHIVVGMLDRPAEPFVQRSGLRLGDDGVHLLHRKLAGHSAGLSLTSAISYDGNLHGNGVIRDGMGQVASGEDEVGIVVASCTTAWLGGVAYFNCPIRR
jgi:hypothetical protein